MKNTPNVRRLSAQDLTVVLAVSAISLLASSALLNTPILPTLIIMALSSVVLTFYGLMRKTVPPADIGNASIPQTDEEYLAAQANMAERSDFLANASHELKTPVASLLGYIETLRGHAKNDPQAREKFLGIMQSQAERMQRLINDLLSLRRIEQIEHIVPSETADLYLAVKSAIESVEPLAKKRNITIKLTAQKNAHVTGYKDELIQLVLNLLDNAVKISDPKTKVSLSIKRTEKWVSGQTFIEAEFSEAASNRHIVSPMNTHKAHYVLKLRDHGPGVAREHLPRIGERFYRIAGDLSSQEKGTGLGLAIAKHIILRHRGGLLIQSSPGEGTEFTVLLPAADEPIPE